MKKTHLILILIVVVAVLSVLLPALNFSWVSLCNWGIISAILVILIVIAFFLKFEEAATGSREIAVVAMLGTISAVLRVPFAAVPGVQPCTCIIICTGCVFGPLAGFTTGAVTVLVSNFFLGHGPWTLYQMIAWGLAGFSAGFLGKFRLSRVYLVIVGVIWGYLYGLITNLWFWTAFIYPLTINTLIVTEMNAIWFDTLHAAGNAVFLGILGQKTITVLKRYRDRFAITILR